MIGASIELLYGARATLLIEDVLNIAKAILAEYDRTDVLQLLRQTAAVLAYRGTSNEPAYPQESEALRAKARIIIEDEPIFMESSRVKDFARGEFLEELLPSDIANIVLLLLKPIFTLAGVSSEANDFLNRVANARTYLTQLIDVSAKLGIQPLSFPSDKAALLTRIPQELFTGDAGELTLIIRNVNEFISDVTEMAGHREIPEFRYASTSEFSFWQLITFDNAVKLLQVIKSCYEAAKSYIDMRRSAAELRKADLQEEVIKKFEHRTSESIANSLGTAVDKIFGLAAHLEPGRPVELRSRVVNKANYVANQMELGLTITIETREETTIKMLSKASPEQSEEDIKKLIEQNTLLQQQLGTIIRQAEVYAITDKTQSE